MTQGFDAASINERLAAFRSAGPRQEELVVLAAAVGWIVQCHNMAPHEATAFLLDELDRDATTLTLYRLFSSGRVMPIAADRVPMDPDARIPGSSATHYPSERDRILSDLRMATIFGHRIGHPTHPATADAASLHLVQADFFKCYVDGTPFMLSLSSTPQQPATEPAPPAVPSAVTSVAADAQAEATHAAPPRWTNEHLQTLVNAVDTERRQGGERGSIGRVLKKWDKLFPARPRVSRTALLAALKRADDKGIGPESAATWLSPVRKPKSTTSTAAHRPGRVHKLGD
jgi:hypothetical protein